MSIRDILDKVKRAVLTGPMKAQLRDEITAQVQTAFDKYADPMTATAHILAWLQGRLGNNFLSELVMGNVAVNLISFAQKYANDKPKIVSNVCTYLFARLGL